MKRLLCPILIFALLLQFSGRLFLAASYQLNKTYIANNLCENREKGDRYCKGRCFVQKQLKEEAKREQAANEAFKKPLDLFVSSMLPFHSAVFWTQAQRPRYLYFGCVLAPFVMVIFKPPTTLCLFC